MKATEDKNQAIAQAEKTAKKAGLADRLINGLSGENKRWNEEILKFEVDHDHLAIRQIDRALADSRGKTRRRCAPRIGVCFLRRTLQYAFPVHLRS